MLATISDRLIYQMVSGIFFLLLPITHKYSDFQTTHKYSDLLSVWLLIFTSFQYLN